MVDSRGSLLTLSNTASAQLKLIAVDFPVRVSVYVETLLLFSYSYYIYPWQLLLPLNLCSRHAAAFDL